MKIDKEHGIQRSVVECLRNVFFNIFCVNQKKIAQMMPNIIIKDM